MRKKFLVLAACAALAVTGCGAPSTTNQTTSSTTGQTSSSESTPNTDAAEDTSGTASDAGDTAATEAPAETTIKLGEKSTVGDWKITAKKVQVTKKIKNGSYRYFEPSKGNSFVVVSLSVKNNGKEQAEFLPSVVYQDKSIYTSLLYQGDTEYKPTQLLSYDKDLTTKKIAPLAKSSGIIAFEVPKKVAKAKKELTLKFALGEESVVYDLK